MVFHPDFTPDNESDDKDKEPGSYGRAAHFGQAFLDSRGKEEFFNRLAEHRGFSSADEMHQVDADDNEFQQIIHKDGDHVNGANPLETCEECKYLRFRHRDGAHHNDSNSEGVSERNTCWDCKNGNGID
jgi:hypothetical protein